MNDCDGDNCSEMKFLRECVDSWWIGHSDRLVAVNNSSDGFERLEGDRWEEMEDHIRAVLSLLLGGFILSFWNLLITRRVVVVVDGSF